MWDSGPDRFKMTCVTWPSESANFAAGVKRGVKDAKEKEKEDKRDSTVHMTSKMQLAQMNVIDKHLSGKQRQRK